MWDKLPPGELILTASAESFLDGIGLPGGNTAMFNEQEKIFFSEIYALARERMTPNASHERPAQGDGSE